MHLPIPRVAPGNLKLLLVALCLDCNLCADLSVGKRHGAGLGTGERFAVVNRAGRA